MAAVTIDLAESSVRELNAELHAPRETAYEVLHPQGAHAIAAGVAAAVEVQVRGHAGYYAAGMNHGASITVHGSVGTGSPATPRSPRAPPRTAGCW